MAQIFFSYKSSDKDRVRPLVKLFEAQGWTVWWDRRIPAGKTFDEVIEEAIKAAACIVVVWSKDSVQSRWVKNEAAEGAKRDILVPVLIDDVEPPFEFRRVQAAKLLQLDDTTQDDPEFRNLIASVSDILKGTSRGRQSQSQSQSQIMRALRLDKESREARKGRPGHAGRRSAKERSRSTSGGNGAWPSRSAAGSSLCVAAYLLLHFVWPIVRVVKPPPFNGSLTFIGVEADAEDKQADLELISYLRRRVETQPSLSISQQTYGYGVVVDKLADWKDQDDGAFLARTTPYVYVAAEMLGADLSVLATYRSKATNSTTYRSYFVVNRADFPQRPPTLDELVSFLKVARRRFIFHSRFSTSSYFLPSLFFHQHHIFHMDQSTDALWAMDAAEVPGGSSTELVKRVARREANLAAVWDGTKVKFDRGNPSFQEANAEFADQVYFIPIDTPLPNDLLVCSASLPTAVKEEIRRAVGEMAGQPVIGIGDFLWWEEFPAGEGRARGAGHAPLGRREGGDRGPRTGDRGGSAGRRAGAPGPRLLPRSGEAGDPAIGYRVRRLRPRVSPPGGLHLETRQGSRRHGAADQPDQGLLRPPAGRRRLVGPGLLDQLRRRGGARRPDRHLHPLADAPHPVSVAFRGRPADVDSGRGLLARPGNPRHRSSRSSGKTSNATN